MISYVLKLISPLTSEKETDALVARVMGRVAEVSGHSETRVSEKSLSAAVLHQFSIEFLSPAEAETFRHELWDELMNRSFAGPAPYAVSFVSKAVAETPKRLAVFDMDSTVINQEVIDEIARKFGLYEQIAVITEEAMQGKLDFKQSLIKRCGLLKGMPFSKAESIIPELTVSPGGDELMQTLRAKGLRTAIVSGGFEFVLRHFQKQLQVDEVHGHHLNRDANNALDGTVSEPIIDAERKKWLVAQMKQQNHISKEATLTVGDGANDIQMMGEAGMSVSFCGKPKLAMIANTLILQRNLLWLKHLI
jgi:phosphoserine phosphatase